MAGVPEVHARYHAATGAMTYVVHDPLTRDAAIVDPVLDLDPATGRARTGELEPVLDLVRDLRLRVRWILETHVHADHVSAAWRLRDLLGGSVGTGQHVVAVRDRLAPLHPHLRTGAGAHGFDRLFADGEELSLGAIAGRVFHTPDIAFLRSLSVRRRGFSSATTLFSGRRLGALRLPGRRRARSLSLGRAPLESAAGDAALHMPRLPTAIAPAPRLGDECSRAEEVQHPPQ